MNNSYLATVDLGSNSFRLLIGKVVNNQFHTTFSFKENVQLAYGLDNRNILVQESIDRAESKDKSAYKIKRKRAAYISQR